MPDEGHGHGHEPRKTNVATDHGTNTHGPVLKRPTTEGHNHGDHGHGDKDVHFHHKRSTDVRSETSEGSASPEHSTRGSNKSKTQGKEKNKERHVDLSGVDWKSGASRKVGFQGKGHRESHLIQQLRRGTKHPGLMKMEEVDSESDGEAEDLKRASWTTASFTEVPNALDELEQQHHPSKTAHHQHPPHHQRQSESENKKYSTASAPNPTLRFMAGSQADLQALLTKHGAKSKTSVLAKYFRTNVADEGTQAGVPTSDWLSRLEQMLIHFFLMIFESSADSSKLIMEMMPTEASSQIDQIFQLLLKAEPEMYKEMGNLVSIAENWLILSREDSEKRQKALDYVRLYMAGVKNKNYYKLPIQVRLHKLGAFITGLNAMGKGEQLPVRYPILKTNPPVNRLRLGSPRVKPATHFSRVVANILSGRPCDDPLPIEDIYADKLAKNIFKDTLHGDKEFKTYTDKKYGSLYKKSDLFSPFLKVDAMAVQGGGDSGVAERFIHKDDCLQNMFCWLPKYTRSYVEGLKGNGCELLAKNNFDKGIERSMCGKGGKNSEACKEKAMAKKKKGVRHLKEEWVRGKDGRVYRKTAYVWGGTTGSVDSIFNDPRDDPDYGSGRGRQGGGKGRGKRFKDDSRSGKDSPYAGKANSDTKLAKHGYGRGHHGQGGYGKGHHSKGVQYHGHSPGGGGATGIYRGGPGGHGGGGHGRGGGARGEGGRGVYGEGRAYAGGSGPGRQGGAGRGGGAGGGGHGRGGGGPGQGRGNKRGSEGPSEQAKKLKNGGGGIHAYRLEAFSPLDGSGDSGIDEKDPTRLKKGAGGGGQGGPEEDANDKSKKKGGGLPGVPGAGGSKDRGGPSNKYGQRQGQAGSMARGQQGRGGHGQYDHRGQVAHGYGHDRSSKFGVPSSNRDDSRKTFAAQNRRTLNGVGGRRESGGRRGHYSFESDEWGGEDYDLDYFMLGHGGQDDGRGDDPNLLSLNQCWEKAAKLLKRPNKSLVIPPAENMLLYLEKKFAKARWARGSPVATRHYPNGSLFVAQYGNGASRVFYPHGGLAADISGPSPSTSQILLVRDPSDGIFFFDKALLADLNSSGKGVIYGDDGVIKAQYSAIGGFKLDSMEKGQRWQWNQGGQRLTMKLNNYISLRLSDQDRIFLNFYGNSRGFFVNVASGHEVILMNPKRKEHDPIANELKNLVRPKVEDDHFDYIRGHFKPRPTIGFIDKPKHYSQYFDAEMRDLQRKSTRLLNDDYRYDQSYADSYAGAGNYATSRSSY